MERYFLYNIPPALWYMGVESAAKALDGEFGTGDDDGMVVKLLTADVALAGQPMKIKIIIWMYFDGYIISADKFGNLNLGYIGRKLGIWDWIAKNPITTDDAEDSFWIDYGFKMASEGR